MKLKLLIMTTFLSFTTVAWGNFGDLNKAYENEIPTELKELEAFELPSEFVLNSNQQKNFPNKNVRAFDPVNKKSYQKAMVGESYKIAYLDSLIRGYTHWRYVTVYNVKTSSERVAYLPYFEEECHDSSFFMGQWGESRSMKVTLSTEVGGSVSYAGMGISASVGMSIEEGVTFSTQRRVQAIEGIHARHYPYKISDSWKGVTYVQLYNNKTKKYGFLGKSYYNEWFGGYPYKFSLDNQNVGLKVKREVLNVCAGYDQSTDPLAKDEAGVPNGF